MQINSTRGSPEFQKLFYRVAFLDDWEDIDDYFVKFGPENNLDAYSEHSFLWERFDSLSLLLEKNVIDLSYFYDLLRSSVLVTWDKFEPVINVTRTRTKQPKLWNQFEYLATEIRKIKQ